MSAASDRRYRARLRRKGCCSSCSRKAVTGHTKCESCMERQRVYAREHGATARLWKNDGFVALSEAEIDRLQEEYRLGPGAR